MIRECWLLILCIFFIQGTDMTLPSVLWRCWLGSRKGIWPVKNWVVGAGVVICLGRGADLHMAQQMPLPLTVSCFSKIQIGFTFLVLFLEWGISFGKLYPSKWNGGICWGYDIGLDPVGAPHAYEKQEVGKPSRTAAQPCAGKYS